MFLQTTPGPCKNVFFWFAICLLPLGVFAQKAHIQGTIKDTFGYKWVQYASINLIRISDSVLVSQSWLREKDQFEIIVPDTGWFRLQITRIGYADYDEDMHILRPDLYDVGIIGLIPKSHLLKEVLVKDRAAIRIKGDTTEFLADSFMVSKNANVEDLLKKLPGLQVDKNGKITAQGQEVKKVLVDGEEFFGNDPTIATRNLKAENIEKVQVFDKKSEQEVLTGSDDGKKEQTINLTLKENAKKGYFGKAQLAEGRMENAEHTRMYEDDFMLNRFKNKRKYALYAASTNTNKTGLSWEETDKYTDGSANTTFGDDGSITTTYSSTDAVFNGQGIPQTWYTGGFFSDKWKDEKWQASFNGSHKAVVSDGFTNNYTKTILPDTFYFNNQRNDFHFNNQQSAGSVIIKFNPDTINHFRLELKGTQGVNQSINSFTTQNKNSLEQLINENKRVNSTTSNRSNFSLLFNASHRFSKKGRSILWNTTLDQNQSNGSGFLNSLTNLYDGNQQIIHHDSIDQKKVNSQTAIQTTSTVTYTEPLTKGLQLSVDYQYALKLSESTNQTFQKDQSSDYSKYIDTLSNHFTYTIQSQRAGLNLTYSLKRWSLNAGSKLAQTQQISDNRITDSSRVQRYLNVFPYARIGFQKKGSLSANLSYSGSSQQPSLNQIQPLKDNSNPLSIQIGNTALVQKFLHNFSLSLNQYKALQGSGFYVNANFNIIQHDFAQLDVIDAYGRSTHQTVNVDGNKSASMYGYWYHEIKKWELNIDIGGNGHYSDFHNFINGLANLNKSFSNSVWFNVYKEKEDKYSTYISYSYSVNWSQSSLRKDIQTFLQTHSISLDGTLHLPHNWLIRADINTNIRQRTTAYAGNYNTCIINTFLTKKFLKDKNLLCSIGINDILNQNIGFDRSVSSNYINENTYTVIKRYWMFSLVYEFKNQ